MADGNVGSLYMTLGLKDEVTVGLNKVTKSLSKSKQYTDELKKEVEGLRRELKGVSGTDMSEPLKKALDFIKKYDSKVYESINETNRLAYALRGVFENNKGEIKINLASIPKAINELAKLSKQLDGYGDNKEGAKAFKNSVANAIDYLKMLQSIERKQRELNDLAISSRNIDKADIASAKMMLNDLRQSFAKQLFNRESGSLIDTNFMSEVKKILSMTMTEISDYMRNLKKDNPLSVFVNSADMLTSKISLANKKILEMQSLMRGSKLPNLFDDTALRGLRGIVGEMQKLIQKEGKGEKTDINKINRLVSEYAKLTSQAELATSTFRRMSREYDNASARLVSWYSKYRELQSIRDKRVSLYLDTKGVDTELARIRAMFNELNAIRRGLKSGNEGFIGMLGSRGTGVDTRIYDNVVKSAKEGVAKQEKLDKAIDKSIAKREKADADEYNRQKRQTEQRLSDINREGMALQRNAEIQQKLQAQQERNQKKQDNEALKEEYRLREAKLKQLEREAKIAMKNEEAQRRLSEQQSRLHTRMSNEITTVSSKVEGLTSIYRRLTSEMNRSALLGIDTSKIQAEISRIESQILRLLNIKKGLETGDTSYLGAHRTIGTAADRSTARSVFQEYRDLNSEKEKSIRLEARHQLEVSNTAAKVRNDLARAFEQVNTHASKTSGIVRDLKSLFLQGGLVFGAQQFFNFIVRTGGEIVQQHIALRSIIGDIQKADELFAQTQQLALQSPFKFGELNRDVKQLAAFGVEAGDLYDTTKRLADIASGLGVSFERLGLAYGQVKARSWLDGKELRQFAYAGLPLLERITQLYNATAKNGRTNYTQSDVKKMITNREVSFEDVKTVLWNMTNEGGQFYNMQLVLSETLLGRWNKLIDAWEIMLGKFAEGNNVVGGTFKMIIDQVTNLTLALDRLSPVLVAATAVFVGKKALGLIPMGITKELSAMQTATNLELRRYAVKQQELVTEGKITQAKAAQNVMMRGYMLADKQTQIATMQKLALEGKLSLLQMQKAVREGLVKKELIQELEILGLISTKQAELIMQQGMRSTAQLAGMQAMGGIGKGASALLGAFGGPWGIAAMLGMSMWMGYSQFEDKFKESIDNLKTSAQQKFEQLNNYLNGMGAKPQDSENLKTQVDSMKEILEQSGYYTDSIKEQVENTVKLTGQYDILKKKIEEARNASQFDVAFAGSARNAVTMSGQTDSWFGTLFGLSGKIGQITDKLGWTETGGVFGWFSGIFNDDIVKNAEQLAESLNKVSSLLMTMDSKKIEEVANQFLSAGDRTKTLEEKLRILKGSSSWDGFVKKIIEGGVLTEDEIESIGDKAEGLIDDINEIKDDDIPKIMEELARQRNMELSEFKIWAKDHPIAFGNMLDTIMKTIGDKGPKIKELLYDAFYGFMGMAKPQEPNYNKGSYRNPIKGAFANQIKQQLFSNGSIKRGNNNGKYWVRQIDTYLSQVDKDTYQETGEAILKNYKQWRNEVDTMDTSGADKNSAKYKRAKWMLDLWDTIRKAGNLSEDVGKNKNTGNFGKEGSGKEDEELKALRERIDAFKAFRQMYQKAKEVIPKDKAKDWAYGLFPEMKDLNPDDYIGSIEKLKKGFNFDLSTERKKALTSLNREIGDWKISELLKPEFEKAAANFKEALDKTMKQWDLWRTLMDKTGNENFANLAFTNGGIFDEQAKNLIRQFEADYNMKFPGIYANDGDAKKSFEGIAGAYERWKAIADLVKNNYVKYLQDAADIIEKTASFEEKRGAVRARYSSLISTAEKVGDTQTAARYTIQRDKELGNVNLEEFKQSKDYLNFFGAVMTMTAEQAQDTANRIKETLLKALGEGSMDAREYAKQIDQVNEQLKAVSKGKKTFWNSGMQGVREQKLQDAYDEQTVASNTFDGAFRKYNEAVIEGNAEGMESAKMQMDAAKKQLEAAGKKVKEENKKSALNESFVETVKKINSNVDSLVSTFNDIKETADLLGVDTTTDAWQDVSAAFESLQGISNGISQAVTSYQSGNYMGVVQGVVSVFTSPIKAFAKAHDAKMDRRIQQAERNIRAIDNMSSNIRTILEKILGGLYSYTNNADTVNMLKDMMKNNEKGSEAYNAAQKALNSGNYFDTQYAALLAQKSEIQKQRDAEDRKKKTDQDAIAQYDQQLKELDLQIKAYAQDFLKEMYSIDFKSWASQLTDAIVEAWAKGENAADAYHDKVQELMKDLTKNILSQKVMEIALKPTLDMLEDALKSKGRLDETDIPKITKKLIEAGDNAVNNITDILDALKEQGIDLSHNGTLSVSNSIKSITEDTADLLASYLNAIRLDVSVNRENLRLILVAVQSVPELNNIARSQLSQLTTLVSLAEARNGKLDDMYSWMTKVTNGVLKISMK